MYDPTTLAHYGVMGMKWGVRRYQNYDGSYTQKGLKRFREASAKYDSANSRLKSAKASYKSGAGSKEAVRSASLARKQAKAEMSKRYDKLKTDKMADKGKLLYQEGKTINDNYRTNKTQNLAIAAAALGAGYVTKRVMSKYDGLHIIHTPVANLRKSDAYAAAVTAGVAATGFAVQKYRNVKAAELRAYYSHTNN